MLCFTVWLHGVPQTTIAKTNQAFVVDGRSLNYQGPYSTPHI